MKCTQRSLLRLNGEIKKDGDENVKLHTNNKSVHFVGK